MVPCHILVGLIMSDKRNNFKRKTSHRGFIGERFLIACEGESEKLYFEGLRDAMRNPIISVKIINELHKSDPLQVVLKAKEVSKIKNKKSEIFEYVWIVIDGDKEDRFAIACEYATKLGIFVAFSNPCFELWLLLHYKNHNGYISANQVMKLLKNENTIYDKTNERFFKTLTMDIKKVQIAITNSKQLQMIHAKNQNPMTSNPSTTVHELVEKIIVI